MTSTDKQGVKPGTKVTCPKCRMVVGEFLREPKVGDIIDFSLIQPLNHEPPDRSPMICFKCGEPYGVHTNGYFQLHTEYGWAGA